MNIGPREQLLISVMAAVVVVVLLVVFLVVPQYQQLGVLDGQIANAKADSAAAKALVGVRQESKNRAAETDAHWLRLANLAPESPDLPSLIVELQDAAFASGVQLIGVTPSEPKPSAKYYSIPIQMQVIGTWADTVDFLQRIGKLNRGMRILTSSSVRTDNTEQSSKENESIPDYAEATTINLEAYMIPASSAGTATPAPAAPKATP